ncbi:STN domain-containing protein [Paenalcaligenes niemegkensis]|uniref:STN domain-containing protein n=1 Tax=Paenalcaligenes niemegkensis TaxID=2895469 RepID=UPI001EE8C3A1|nr:STN domain-containing protein [Paenalcaligenes niemegkensis]MCQ9616637.1 STN domain-containing protein [Paenalcaligenes niemegkensis]
MGSLTATVQAQEVVPHSAAGAQSEPAAGTHEFSIPPLPLNEALTHYTEATGYSVFYETSVVAGKKASAVQGHHSAEAALRQLLSGSNLTARFVNQRSIMLTTRQQPAPQPGQSSAPSMAQRRYDGKLQQQVTQALCANPAIGAGQYRIALRFAISGNQRIHQLRVRVAEQPDIEPAVRGALADLPVAAPPPDFSQPVVMIVSPEAARRYGACPP